MKFNKTEIKIDEFNKFNHSQKLFEIRNPDLFLKININEFEYVIAWSSKFLPMEPEFFFDEIARCRTISSCGELQSHLLVNLSFKLQSCYFSVILYF